MKTILNGILLFLSLLIFSNCKSQEVYSKDVAINSFSQIEIQNGVSVEFHESNIPKVVIEVPDLKYAELFSVENVGSKLMIEKKKSKKQFDHKIIVYGNSLNSIKVIAGCAITFKDKMISDNLEISVESGSAFWGDFQVNNNTEILVEDGSSANLNLTTNTLNLTATNGSSAKISGNADTAQVLSENASSVNAKKLVCDKVKAKSINGSSVSLNSTNGSEIESDISSSVSS